MLKQRLLTAALLIPLVVWAVWHLATPPFALALAGVVALAGWEWAALMGVKGLAARGLYPLLLILLMALVWEFAGHVEIMVGMLAGALIWWMVLAWLLLRATARPERFPMKGWAGVVTLIPAWFALVLLHAASPHWVLFLIGLTVVADSGAYFAGRRWGRVKLAPTISPGKSREGVYGGMAAVGLYAAAAAPFLQIEGWRWALFVAVAVVTALISVVGDLFESLLKREVGAKDSGRLLPGHGGILDRIDSLTAAAPFFLAGWLALGIG